MRLVPPVSNLVPLALLASSFAAASPVQLRTDHLTNPIGIDTPRPQFAWQSDATTPNWMQSSYQLLVATNEDNLVRGKADVWDSGRITSSDSINITYGGPTLKPQTRYFWLVRVWDKKGSSSVSDPAWFETGLLSPSDWTAKWIRRIDPAADQELAAVRWLWLPGSDAQKVVAGTTAEFRYTLHLESAPMRASLHIVSPGAYVATVNGVVTGHHTSWGAFDWEEIGPLLKPGDNEVLVRVVAQTKASAPTVATAFAASLRITAQDGTEHRVPSDATWLARTNDTAQWQPAQVIGPITTPLSIGTDRHSEVPGPNRIATDASLLRKDFELPSSIQSARLTITAIGAYQAFLNGKPVAPQNLLDPGFTDFHKRVLYQTYDVTSMLTTGDNTIAAVLGGGWHGSPMTWAGTREYPNPDALRAQLDITLTDGSHKTIATDETWQTAAAPILFSEIYAGEVYDARLESPGWNSPHFNPTNDWIAAAIRNVSPNVKLTAQPNLSITATNTLHPIAMTPANEARQVVYDMGQNMVGNIVLHVQGPRGTLVRMRFAERLNPDGSIYTENLRNATVTDTYVLSGNGDETYTPAFTFHGFRYAEIEATAGARVTSIEVLVVASDLSASGDFSCSDARVNQLFSNVRWSQRGNFLSIPTDCPQRDERLGWTGDIQVFAEAACANADAGAFLASWLRDLALEQRENGCVASVIPNVLGQKGAAWGACGWGDAATVVPWRLYEAYGDLATLARQYPSMRGWVDWCASRRDAEGCWSGDFQFGDWLDPAAPPDKPNQATTSGDYIATAYLSFSAGLVAKTAALLGHADAAEQYAELSRQTAAAAWARWGAEALTTQAGCAVAIELGVVPAVELQAATDALAALVNRSEGRIATGFLGTPLVLPALCRGGHYEAAYRLLMNPECPGWLHQVLAGATTMWERWDAIRADGSILGDGPEGTPGSTMSSFNHYAYGAVAAWLYRTVAGIAPGAPGYAEVVFAPVPGGGLGELGGGGADDAGGLRRRDRARRRSGWRTAGCNRCLGRVGEP